MKMKLDMLGIITSKFDEMKKFYQEVMGFEVSFNMENYVEFKNEGTRFAITNNSIMREFTEDPSYDEEKKGQSLELAFLLDSPKAVDEAYEELIEKGAKAIKAPKDMPWGQRAGFFADPDGNIHEVFCNLS